MDPSQFGEWVDTFLKWATYIPELILYAGYKVLLPWIGLASVVAKITPSEADNKWVDRMLNAVQTSALNPNSKMARETVGITKKPK